MILFCGDVHGNFAHVIKLTLAYRPASVILLGDLQAQRPLEVELADILDLTEVFFIHGNHDTDSEADYRNLFGSALADRSIHGRVVEIDGLRIAGLGGIFRGKIWMPPAPPVHQSFDTYVANDVHGRRRLSKMDLCQLQAAPETLTDLQDLTLSGRKRKHKSSIFPDVYNGLASQRADVLVTHEAPGAHPYGFAAIDDLARSLGASKVFHGHHHDRFQYVPTDFRAYAVGFCGVTDELGNVIQAGDFDDARLHRNNLKGGGDRE